MKEVACGGAKRQIKKRQKKRNKMCYFFLLLLLLFDLNLCIANGTVSTKIYDKRDDFDFNIVNLFPFSGWRCPPAYLIWGIHISTY